MPIDTYSEGIKLEDASIVLSGAGTGGTESGSKGSFPEALLRRKETRYAGNILEVIMEPERQLESPEFERPLKQDI